MTPSDEPPFSAVDVPQGEGETAVRAVAAANALVEAAEGRLNPVELAGIARSSFEESLRRDLLPTLEVPPACRRGCAWCCHSPVRASIAEAVSLAAYILTAKTAEERERIRARLDVYVGEASGLAAKDRLLFKKPCPFLEDGECSVYPVRPMICAGFLSPTPEGCERAAGGCGEMTLTVRDALERAGFLCLVLSKMFGAFGLEAEPVDLAAGVKTILDDPTSVDRWGEGEKVFSGAFLSRLTAGAALRDDEEERRLDRAVPLLIEELGRRAGAGAAASIREALERWRKEGVRHGAALPSLMPRS